ncbi:MAG: hypothetical protein Q8K65_05375 [Alphaproteobacteria bacterium]|nr:hypothetical protein [Alphaproteobacteria bacterium]
MSQPPPEKTLSQKFSRLRGGDSERFVSAYAPTDEGGFVPVVFRSSRVDMIVGLDENFSALRLDDGVTIPAALPLQELRAIVFGDDYKNSGDIDLMTVTGEAAAEARKVTLSRKFNPTAQSDSAADDEKGVDITVFAHKEQNDRRFHMVRFNTSDMAYFEPHANRPETETFISLKKENAATGFKDFYVQMPMTNFMWNLEAAKKSGRVALDLTETTRASDAKGFEL